MSKKYLITKVIAGEKQGFLKNVTKDGGEWINGAEHKDIAHIRIIEL